MGAYHFARPDLNPTNAGAIAEANYFLSVAGTDIISCQLPPSLDLEGSYLLSSFTSAQLTAWVQNWMNTVQSATGITPAIYIGNSTCSYLNSSLNTYPLWRDDVNGNPSLPPTNIGVWTTWAFNQYDWTGTVPGIAGSLTDLDVFNGSTVAFNSFMGCSTTTVEEENITDAFVVYPNPASNSFQIEFKNTKKEAVLSIYDMSGRIILNKNITDQTIIDVADLKEGIYVLRIKTSDGITTNKKLIIAH